MKEIHKQVLIDLAVTPYTVVPFLLGSSMLLLSEIMGARFALFGFVSLMFSFGIFASNLIFNFQSVYDNAINNILQKQQQKEKDVLNNILWKLKSTSGTRDENIFSNMLIIHSSFKEDTKENKTSEYIPAEMFDLIDQIFNTCVNKMKVSHEIYETYKKMKGPMKKSLEQKREEILDEVEESVQHLADAINETRILRFKSENTRDLQTLKKKLFSQLNIAKQTEESINAFFEGNEYLDEGDEYLKE